MFIRWIVRGHKNDTVADVTFHDAYLVESYRDDNGKPRQRTLSYLGNIRQIGDSFPAIERELFLLRAESILMTLPDLSEADREDVLKQIQQKVSPLNEAEVQRAFRGNLQWYFKWWKENGTAPSLEDVQKMINEAAESYGFGSLPI